MTPSRLPRHYDALTPWERLPLIVAASARADDVEVDRLIRSAPTHGCRVRDYWGLAEALNELVTNYLLEQLDLVASYLQVMTFREQEPLPSARKAQRQQQQQQEQRCLLSRMQVYQFVVRADGWKQLCAELSIDPDVLLRGQPGFDTLVRFEEQVRPIAFNAEEARVCLRGIVARHGGENEPSGSGREYRLDTAADVARSMREFLEKRRDAWR